MHNVQEAAEDFAQKMRAKGFQFDYSVECLRTEIDQIIDLPIFNQGRESSPTSQQEENEAGLSAYVGESLVQNYSGIWEGEFDGASPGINFYRSHIMFGEFKHNPHISVAYRLTNGECEGTYRRYLSRLVPIILARAPFPNQI